MGHSAGGFQALDYGIHHNEKLKGIIAIDAIAGRDSLYDIESAKMIMKRKGQPYYEKGQAILFGADTTNYSLVALLSIILPFYFHNPSNMASFLKIKGVTEMSDKAWSYTRASKMGTEYLFPELKKIKVPVLVIVGDDDFICDKVSQADRIAKNIPSATELVIKDAGHFPWAEQPEEFDNGCSAWLKKQKLKE